MVGFWRNSPRSGCREDNDSGRRVLPLQGKDVSASEVHSPGNEKEWYRGNGLGVFVSLDQQRDGSVFLLNFFRFIIIYLLKGAFKK